jgi:hypothetical protein
VTHARGIIAVVLAAGLTSGLLQAAGPRAQATAGAPRFVLVDKGRPAATIVVPLDADPSARRAAALLQDAVQRMSGAALPILETARPGRAGEIAIGFGADRLPAALTAPRLTADGFLVATSGRNLYIRSGGDKGAIYGVVHLLERYFGCRRFSPTSAVFPRRATLSLGPVSDVDNPVNQIRIVNGDFSKDENLRDWLRLDVTDDVFGRGYYVHTFNRLVPWEKHFAEHPEYFSWMNGKRIKDQLCLSHSDVLKLAVETLAAEVAAQPDRQVWSVSQNDNFSYCQCPDCRKIIEEEGSPAGPVIRFVNQAAARLPHKIISTLAYQYSRQAPKVVRPADNVQIMLCTIELNRSLPIEDDPSSRQFLQDIADWGKISRNIYLWDYTVNFNHHVSPFPNLHVLQPNIRFFVRNGARQHFQQSNTGAGHEFSELKQYLLARLLWNPDADSAAVVKEFLDGHYGAAGPWIAKYIAGLRDALAKSGARLDIYEPPAAYADGYLSADRVARYIEWFDQAEAAVRGEAEVLERVKTARLPLQYAMLEIAKSDLFGPRGFYRQEGERFAPKPDMARLLEDFFQGCSRNGVRTLNESGLTPKQYYDAARRFIDVQVEGNKAFRKPVTADPPPSPKYSHGNLALLTDGVRGASDFKVQWLGWEGPDVDLVLDLGSSAPASEASISTLWDARSWILHPRGVTCLVSADGVRYQEIQTIRVESDQRAEGVTRTFTFDWAIPFVRFIKFHIEGTHTLPDWHPSAGGTSWVFVDEIVAKQEGEP